MKNFYSLATKTAHTLVLNLRTDGLSETIFEWQTIYEEILGDLKLIGLQADAFYCANNLKTGIPESNSFVCGLILRRAERLRHFLKKLAGAVEEFSNLIGTKPKATALRFLDSDSHNQGERPVTFQLAGYDYVLKFRDPRPYQILQHVLRRLQTSLQIELAPPDIWCSPSNNWHVMPYLTTDKKTSLTKPTEFMTRLGAITAAAYFLQMTDLHLDNVLVNKGTPIIIDSECMFYGYHEYSSDSIENRLWNTGLVGENPALSAIRGGTAPIFDFGAKEELGKITYLRQTGDRKSHRLIDDQGNAVDPVHYTAAILDGFSRAYETLCTFKNQLSDEIEAIALPDMRTRFLLRLTIHYATMIEILRKPTNENDITRLGKLTSVFLKSGGMSNLIDDQTKRCELHDMLDSDFPLFWVEDVQNTPMLMHWSGSVRALSNHDSLQNRIKKAVTSCTISDLPRLKVSLNKFFLKEM